MELTKLDFLMQALCLLMPYVTSIHNAAAKLTLAEASTC